jgi:hypothetical protein
MSMATRVCQQFVEDGLEAVLSREQRAAPAITPLPACQKDRLVQDNLNTHAKASLYEAFAPVEARRLVALRMALHAQTWQLAEHGRVRVRRSGMPMPGPAHSRQADAKPGSRRMARPPQQTSDKANWRFTTAEARIKLKRLYPRFE